MVFRAHEQPMSNATQRRELRELRDLAQEARQILYAVRKLGDDGFKSREEVNRTRNRILVMQARAGEIIKNLQDMHGLLPSEGQQARRELIVVRASIREVVRHVAEHGDYAIGGSFLGLKPAEGTDALDSISSEPGLGAGTQIPKGLKPRTPVMDRRLCPLCQYPLSRRRLSCILCRREHHWNCWDIFGGCAVEVCYLDPVIKRIESGALKPVEPEKSAS